MCERKGCESSIIRNNILGNKEISNDILLNNLLLVKIGKLMAKKIATDFECNDKDVDVFDLSYEDHKIYCGYRVNKDEHFTHGSVSANIVLNK